MDIADIPEQIAQMNSSIILINEKLSLLESKLNEYVINATIAVQEVEQHIQDSDVIHVVSDVAIAERVEMLEQEIQEHIEDVESEQVVIAERSQRDQDIEPRVAGDTSGLSTSSEEEVIEVEPIAEQSAQRTRRHSNDRVAYGWRKGRSR